MSDLLRKTHIKVLLVLWYQGLTCVDPYYHLSKVAYQMWCDCPFGQKSRTTKRKGGVVVGGDKEVGEGGGGRLTKFQKRGGVGNIGGGVFS